MSTLTGSTTTAITIGNFANWIISSSGRVNVNANDAIRMSGQGSFLLVDGEVLARGGTGVLVNSSFGNANTVMITAAGTILASGGNGLMVTSGTANRVVNDGTIFGSNTGLLDSAFASNLQNHGSVTGGFTGMSLSSGFKAVANTGEIAGGQTGLNFAAPNVNFVNTGEITGGPSGGVVVTSTGYGRLANLGEIASTGVGISVSGSGDAFRLINHGTVIGGNDVAYSSSDLADRVDVVRNSGLISGDVRLGDGDDVYRGIGDGRVDGTVFGGPGDDLLIGSHADDVLDGGDGSDELRGRGGDDVLYGGVGADLLIGGRGDDTLYGGAWSDTLLGGPGDDVLYGGGGADTLDGGPGDDVLTGGPGPDVFVFRRNAGDNEITDFRRDQDDKIDLTAFNLLPGGFAKVKDATSDAPGWAVLIDLDALGGQGSVLVNGMGLNNMTWTDFIFA